MLVPQSVSYASALAKLSPVTGLFSASITGIVYALLGSSRQLNVAPDAALSLLLSQAISDIRHDYPDPHGDEADILDLGVATVITLQVSLISFVLGFFRLGFIDDCTASFVALDVIARALIAALFLRAAPDLEVAEKGDERLARIACTRACSKDRES